MRVRSLLLVGAAVLVNAGLAATNLGAMTAGTWRYCNCVHPPDNCCVVEADSCNGCVAPPPQQLAE